MDKKEPQVSRKDSLNREEVLQWIKNSLLFSAPALMAFLTALQSGQNFTIALGMLQQAFLASLIDLLGKYKQGV